MSFYIDTAALVSVFVRQAAADRVEAWLSEHEYGGLSISDWVVTEFSSALALKRRVGTADEALRLAVLARFAQFRREELTTLPVSRQAFETAARFADQHALGVRSGDALHLAIAVEHGPTLCTLDRRLAEAGPGLAVVTRLL